MKVDHWARRLVSSNPTAGACRGSSDTAASPSCSPDAGATPPESASWSSPRRTEGIAAMQCGWDVPFMGNRYRRAALSFRWAPRRAVQSVAFSRDGRRALLRGQRRHRSATGTLTRVRNCDDSRAIPELFIRRFSPATTDGCCRAAKITPAPLGRGDRSAACS